MPREIWCIKHRRICEVWLVDTGDVCRECLEEIGFPPNITRGIEFSAKYSRFRRINDLRV